MFTSRFWKKPWRILWAAAAVVLFGAGLQVIDLRTGDIAQWVRIEGMVSELYDVVVLPGAIRPMAFGFKTDEIQRTLSVGEEGVL